MASKMYTGGIKWLFNGKVDLTTQMEVRLMGNSYTLAQYTHEFVSDITTYESGAGQYVLKALASEAVATTSGIISFDAADVTWTALGGTTNGTVTAAVIYRHSSTDTVTTSPLVCYIDFGDKTTDGSDFTIQWNSNGIFRVDNSA